MNPSELTPEVPLKFTQPSPDEHPALTRYGQLLYNEWRRVIIETNEVAEKQRRSGSNSLPSLIQPDQIPKIPPEWDAIGPISRAAWESAAQRYNADVLKLHNPDRQPKK